MIIWFGGGLGNQLFQYALYRAAQIKGYNVSADLSFYKRVNCHNGFELGKIFSIDLKESDAETLKKYQDRYDITARVMRKLVNPTFGMNKNIIREQFSMFIPDLLSDYNRDAYLQGYWQSDRYFKSIKPLLIEELVFPTPDIKNQGVINEMNQCESVALHVRRGDYLKKENLMLFTNLGDTCYYRSAIDYFESNYKNVRFYVFSNDNDWCHKNLKINKQTVYVDWNTGENSYKDMQLMSECKHNIIANSSFSWWGAWLNKNPEKKVIAPKNWFTTSSKHNDNMIIPEEWVKI